MFWLRDSIWNGTATTCQRVHTSISSLNLGYCLFYNVFKGSQLGTKTMWCCLFAWPPQLLETKKIQRAGYYPVTSHDIFQSDMKYRLENLYHLGKCSLQSFFSWRFCISLYVLLFLYIKLPHWVTFPTGQSHYCHFVFTSSAIGLQLYHSSFGGITEKGTSEKQETNNREGPDHWAV